tara:strand:+ start:2099 stop:3274 length:1176 start_codon:yes stop_codon:yes gene_type:complete
MFFNKNEYIPYGKHSITNTDIKNVIRTLKSDFLTQGPLVPEFEKNICKTVFSDYAVAVNSATSALHIACLALDLKPEEYVWTSPISFVASSNCALYCGAKIDFIDINPNTGLIDENLLENKLKKAANENKLPKILIPVHLAGTSCNMKEIYQLSRKYNFKIIEDASHALGGKYKHKPIGNCQFSDITIFSFHPVKMITTGEGGVATTNDKFLFEKMKKLRCHGITKNKNEFLLKQEGKWHYEQNILGFNYRLSDIQASLGISQLKRLGKIVKKRNELLNFYKIISQNLEISFLDIPEDCVSSVHLAILKLNNYNPQTHKTIFNKMREHNIGIQLHYIPIHLQPFYRNMGFKVGDFPNAEYYAQNSFSIPLYTDLKRRHQIRVINTLKEIIL